MGNAKRVERIWRREGVRRERATGPGAAPNEHSELPAVMRALLDEIMGPDMIGPPGPEPDARPVVQPEPASYG